MKIISIALTRLRNNEYFELLTEFVRIVNSAIVSRMSVSAMSDNINLLLNILKDLLEKLDEALVTLSKSELTDLVTEADNWRDAVYRGFTLHVQAFLNSFDDEKREAARRLQVLINNYGDFRKRPYKDQSAVMHNFIQDLQNMHTANLETIGAGGWVDEMQARNEAFKEIMDERHGERVEQAREAVQALRVQIDDTFRQIVGLIEVGNRLSEGNAYTSLIKQLNEYITYYKNTLATRQGVAEAKKNKDTSLNLPEEDTSNGEDL